MVLRGEFDLSGSFEFWFGLLCGFDLLLFFLLVFVATVEADSRFQDQEDVVTGSLDLADRLRDPVGLGKGIVDRVPQFLHEVLQWLFHRYSLSSGCAAIPRRSTSGSASTRSDCSGRNPASQAKAYNHHRQFARRTSWESTGR